MKRKDHIIVKPEAHQDSMNIRVGVVATNPLAELESGTGWISTIFQQNMVICRKHGNAFVFREIGNADVAPLSWQSEHKDSFRENANFEKWKMLLELLEEPGVTHALIIDADAALVNHKIDSVRVMARELEKVAKDILLADEDWRERGAGRINGGMLFAKATDYSRMALKEMLVSHQQGTHYRNHPYKCIQNDQLCLQEWYNLNTINALKHFHITSGIKYNFAPQVWTHRQSGRFNVTLKERNMVDSNLHIVHFMGAWKNVILNILPKITAAQGLPSVKFAKVLKRHQSTKEKLEEIAQMKCNNGFEYVKCLDVDVCASGAPASGKFAFVLTHTLDNGKDRRNLMPETNLKPMLDQARRYSTDVILIVPRDAEHPLRKEEKENLTRQNILLMEVPWSVPPHAKYHPEKNWCGPQDFLRLHALNLTKYDAVAYYDMDIQLQGDVISLFRCASTGRFLTAPGFMSPLNIGVFAVKPSQGLLDAALTFSETADYSNEDAWDNGGWLPSHGKFPGSECAQGYFHTFLYKRSPRAQRALEKHNVQIVSNQIDQCVWNYQNTCPKRNFNCASVRAHHKGPGHYGTDCSKYSEREGF